MLWNAIGVDAQADESDLIHYQKNGCSSKFGLESEVRQCWM